jgi:hypothetical protein
MSRTARGIYHKRNALKYRILNSLFEVFKTPGNSKWLSTPFIASVIGTESGALSMSMKSYRKQGIVRRSQKKYKKEGRGGLYYKWTITEKGIKVLFDLRNRLEKGYTLNRQQHYKVDSYIGITKQGAIDFCLTEKDSKDVEACFIVRNY